MKSNQRVWPLTLVLVITMAPALAQTWAPYCREDIVASAPDSRFSNNGDGTVTDWATGLIWKQCAEGQSGADCQTGAAGTFEWQQALLRAADAVFAGSSLWRLPNKKELASLVEQRCYPAINSHFFPNSPFAYPYSDAMGDAAFWSSSHYPDGSSWLCFSCGFRCSTCSRVGYVRLVRDRQ